MPSINPIVLLPTQQPRILVTPKPDPKTGRAIDMTRDPLDPELDTLARQFKLFRGQQQRAISRDGLYKHLITFETFVEVAEFLAKAEMPETKNWQRRFAIR